MTDEERHEDWKRRLRTFEEMSGVTRQILADEVACEPQSLLGAKGRPVSRKLKIRIAEAMRVNIEILDGAFEEFERALRRAWKLTWSEIIREGSVMDLHSNWLRFEEPHKTRLVRYDNGPSGDFPKIKVPKSYRIHIDLWRIFKRLNLEFENDELPLDGFRLYVFQIEGDRCLILRPNSFLNPENDPDWVDPEIDTSDTPRWKLILPPPVVDGGMEFDGTGGTGDLYVLLSRRALAQSLIDEMTTEGGAPTSVLDKLALALGGVFI